MYGIEDTTQYRHDPEQVKNAKKVYRRKKRSQGTRKDTGVQSTKGKKVSLKTENEGSMPTKLVNTKQSTLDEKSLISLYRKRKRNKSDKEKTCNCPFDEEFEIKHQNGNGLNEQIVEEKTNKGHLTDKTCKKGLCSKAMKLKDKDFVCSCVAKKVPKSPVVRCTNTTCRKEDNMSKKSSLTKISEVFQKIMKYGRNVKTDPNDICEEGVCKDAYHQDNQDICCKCKLKVRKCTDTTCTPSKNKPKVNNSSEFQSFLQKFCHILRSKKGLRHPAKKPIRDNVIVQNEMEQTGDPLFEIKVNAVDMSVLNPSEFKDKVMLLGQEKKRDKCICLSHTARKQPPKNKIARRNLGTASLKNVTSKFSGFCNRMFCKSDNRVNWQKNKRQRSIRRRRSTLHTQSNNVRKRQGLKITIKQHDVTPNKTNGNECGENCCTCDNDYKNKQITKESVGDSVKAKIFGKIKQSNKSEVSKENIGDNVKAKNTTNTFLFDKSKRISKTKKPSKQKSENPKELATPEKLTRKVHQRNGVQVPVPGSKLAKKSSMIVKKKIKAICKCHHICECSLEEHRRRIQAIRRQKGSNSKKKKKSNIKGRQWQKESVEKRKHFAKEREQIMKEEEKRHIQHKKEEMEVLKLLESEKGAGRTNCCVEIFGAVVSVGILPVKILIRVLFKTVTDPKGSYLFTSERLKDPQGTYVMIKRAIRDGWRIRKLKITKCMKNSETASVLSDTIKETPLYQTFADKGKTQREQEKTKLETKQRKKRIRQRHDAALYGCRHMLLTTLRKTPCLWVYHVCPEFYPQCLSCLAFTRNFWHMCLFMLALACWTPCIVACELMRGLCCCLLCTG